MIEGSGVRMGFVVRELTTIRSVATHFLRMTMRDRAFTVTAMIIPVNYLFLFLISVVNGGAAPIAVAVAGASGPRAEAFAAAVASTDTFTIQRMDQTAAQRSFDAGSVVAVLTVPQQFDAAVAAGRPVTVGLQIDNVNTDFTDDIRRGMDMAVERFGTQSGAMRNAVSTGNAMDGARGIVAATEVYDVAKPARYVPYVLVSIVVVAIMIGGFFQGGVNVAREYEKGTIVDLALAPVSRTSILLGMIAGTFIIASVGVLLIVALLVGVFGVRPAHWLELAGACALLQAVFAAGGVFLGTAMRQRNGLSGLAILLSLPMLSLSGAFFPAPWSDPVIAALSQLTPTYYANGLMQHAVHSISTTPTSTAADAGALVGFAALAVTATVVLFKRRELAR